MINLGAVIEPHSSWFKIERNDYSNYGIIETTDSKIVVSYNIGKIYNQQNTLTLYNYGKDDGFISELADSYKELQLNFKEQDEYGVFPLYWENFGNGCFLSVLKLITNPSMNIIDIFFVFGGQVYSIHTYLDKKEHNFKLTNLCSKYPNLRHIINELTKIKN